MRRVVFALVLLSTPAGAASAVHGSGCRLSTAECLQVAREIAAEQVLQDEDARTFGFGLSQYDRALALLDRHYARFTARLTLLPPPIAREWDRLNSCRAKDDQARRDGTTNTDPACR